MAKSSVDPGVFKLIDKAKENLAECEYLLKGNFYYGASNRGYYGIFHAISALLLFEGKEFSSHKAVISYFGKHFSKTGKVPKEYHKVFIKAFKIRQLVDYDYEAMVTPDEANLILSKAKEILKFIEDYISTSNKLLEK